jgi:glycosyltransferase involved in cell wall biosynthesis
MSKVEINPNFYRNAYSDLANLTDDELVKHWLEFGDSEGRVTSWQELALCAGREQLNLQEFAWDEYLACNYDLRNAGLTTPASLALHYVLHGKNEKRRISLGLPSSFFVALETGSSTPSIALDISQQMWARNMTGDEQVAASYFCSTLSTILSNVAIENLVINGYKYFWGRPPKARQIDEWCTGWELGLYSKVDLVHFFTDGEAPSTFFQRKAREVDNLVEDRVQVDLEVEKPSDISLMGEKVMDSATWYRRAFELKFQQTEVRPETIGRDPNERIPDETSVWKPEVSVLCSLYRVEKYLDAFLENILEQTLFEHTEFQILLVDPSDTELQICQSLARDYRNIILTVYPKRIGIYQAWNDGIRISKGEFLTNMNADDLRRFDSLEIQWATLKRHEWIDVVYQDVLVTVSKELSWEQVRQIDAKTQLPLSGLMAFFNYLNPPHNAPMWRRKLHDSVGYFDEGYLSASDVDFWIRCALDDKIFFKINDPHVAYFHNPDGLSTSRQGTANSEHSQVLSKYMTPELFIRKESEAIERPLNFGSAGAAASYTRAALQRLHDFYELNLGRN